MAVSVVLVNPRRVTNLRGLRGRLARNLRARAWPSPIWIETAEGDDGGPRVRDALASGARLVYACGGDGTVRTAASALAGSEVPLALLPAGTGNVLALNLGVPGDMEAAIRLGVEGERRRIDLGEVEGRAFAVAAGIGLDAQMIASTRNRTKRLLGWVAYLLAAVGHLRSPGFEVVLEIDGKEIPPRQVRSVLVANVGRLPGGIRLLPAARLDDGLLDVALIAPRRLGDWAQLVSHVLTRTPLRRGLEAFQARRVVIIASSAQPWEIDGESAGETQTLTARVRPGALLVCVPGPVAGSGQEPLDPAPSLTGG